MNPTTPSQDTNKNLIQGYKSLIDRFTHIAPALVPFLWGLSFVSLVLDLAAPNPLQAIEWGDLAAWFALLGVAVSCHVLTRHIISRLTQIIALWQDDVEILHRPTIEAESTIDEESNVVPMLRTAIRRAPARTGTEGLG